MATKTKPKTKKPKKINSDRVLLEFRNEAQAQAFYDWFREYGFDSFIEADSVHDDLPQEDFPECLSSEEEPTDNMDFYFIQIE